MLSAYGAGVLSVDAETWYGLYLNLHRIRLQRVWEFAKAIDLVFGAVEPSRAVFDAVCDSETEASAAWYETIMQRKMAAAMTKARNRRR
jgi:hypothetical protein